MCGGLIETQLRGIFAAALDSEDIFDDFAKLDMPLLGNVLGLKSRHLLFIYEAVQRNFNINIPEQFIVEGRFNTFNNIMECVCQLRSGNE